MQLVVPLPNTGAYSSGEEATLIRWYLLVQIQPLLPQAKGEPLKVLVLEDDKERRRHFKRGLLDHVCAIVETPQDAIEALQEETWDMVFLDYDLDQQVRGSSGSGTGYEVAKWLSSNRDRMPGKVCVHSYNQKGCEKIIETLPEAVLMPGAWLQMCEIIKEYVTNANVENWKVGRVA